MCVKNVSDYCFFSFVQSGVPKLSLMIKKMVGKAPHIYFRLSWLLLCPSLVLVRLHMISHT